MMPGLSRKAVPKALILISDGTQKAPWMGYRVMTMAEVSA